MIKDIIIKFITLLHIFFILFVIITPFLSSNYLLLLYTLTIPFLILHWLCNDNTCVLTIVERKLRGKERDDKDCFTCRLIEPVYDFNKNYETFSTATYIIVISLWLLSTAKLVLKYRSGQITSIQDLMTI